MGRPYSTDLRERVLRACEVGDESQAAIARRFEISESAVGSWLRQLRRDGRREAKPHGRGFPSILDEDDGAVLRWDRQRNGGQAAIAISEPGFALKSCPKPEPSLPLRTAQRTWSRRSAPCRDHRICCDLYQCQ